MYTKDKAIKALKELVEELEDATGEVVNFSYQSRSYATSAETTIEIETTKEPT